jgi:hypothetical protein
MTLRTSPVRSGCYLCDDLSLCEIKMSVALQMRDVAGWLER